VYVTELFVTFGAIVPDPLVVQDPEGDEVTDAVNITGLPTHAFWLALTLTVGVGLTTTTVESTFVQPNPLEAVTV
jgi:hypothetical protein